jgi:hypothetical protein
MIKRVLAIIGLVSMGLAAWPRWDAGTVTVRQGAIAQRALSRNREATSECARMGLAGEPPMTPPSMKLPGMLPPCMKGAPTLGTPPATHKFGMCTRG